MIPLTAERRAVAAALTFLLAAFLAGVTVGPGRVHYALFGITEGLAAILLTFAFLVLLQFTCRSFREMPA